LNIFCASADIAPEISDIAVDSAASPVASGSLEKTVPTEVMSTGTVLIASDTDSSDIEVIAADPGSDGTSPAIAELSMALDDSEDSEVAETVVIFADIVVFSELAFAVAEIDDAVKTDFSMSEVATADTAEFADVLDLAITIDFDVKTAARA